MRLGIMQPYFFPYLGYFALIKHTDQFILFDTPQFIRHGWIERNRITKQNGEPLYIKVPLMKHQRDTKIQDLVINNKEKWKDKILAQLAPYRKKAPNYWKILKLLKEMFEYDTESIVALNHVTLKAICDYLSIATPIKVWSEMEVDIEEPNAPDEWALNICKALGADAYYNPIGGSSFFDRDKYEQAGIELKFVETEPIAYQHLSDEFVPFLSIIDVLMFCDIGETNRMIDSYKLTR